MHPNNSFAAVVVATFIRTFLHKSLQIRVFFNLLQYSKLCLGCQLTFLERNQYDQIGRFLEFLGNNFITKVAKMCGYFLGSCENHRFLIQTGEAIFGQLLEKLGLIFI